MVLLAHTKNNSVGEYVNYVSPLSRARTLHGESDYLTPPVPLPMNTPLFDGDASADFYTITPITMDAPSLFDGDASGNPYYERNL